MGESDSASGEFGELPFHEYCAHCDRTFDEKVLDPTVTVVETDEERVLHSFCDEECFAAWSTDG